jgi:hypothetical protein
MFNSRLLNGPRLQAIAAAADEIANHCTELADALCDYESAAELPADERAEARDDAREAAWVAMGDLLTEAGRLREERDKLDATMA